MQPHDCNASLVGMSACFLSRHSSSSKPNADVRLDAFGPAKMFPIKVRQETAFDPEDFFPETKTVATLDMQRHGYTILQIS
jgi:hypothetical protein